MDNELTLEQVKNFLETNEGGQKWLSSFSDAKVSKAINTWKENNLQIEVDKKVKELYPSEDPKDVEIKKLSMELEKLKNQSLLSELTNESIRAAQEKGLPVDIVKLLITSDKEANNSNLQALEGAWNAALKERIKGNVNSTTPQFNGSSNGEVSIEAFSKMSYQDKKSLKQSDPELYNQLTQ